MFPRPEDVFSGGESDDDDMDSTAKRRREDQDQDDPRAVARQARREERDRRQREYYGSSYSGVSVAYLVWKVRAVCSRSGENQFVHFPCRMC